MNILTYFGFALVFLFQFALPLRCLNGLDITRSTSPIFPVGKKSASAECAQFGNNATCVRISATAILDTYTVDGIGYSCALQSSCSALKADCAGSLRKLLKIDQLNSAIVTNCNIGCCETENCNNRPIGGSSTTKASMLFVVVSALVGAITRF
ncbi:uncharacterized protein LOC100179018 [Ciona intestinalis]